MDPITTIAVSSAAGYLLNHTAEGLLNEVGKAILEKLKSVFTKGKDLAVLEQFTEDPANEKLQGKLELRMEDILETDQAFKAYLDALVGRLGVAERQEITNFVHSKNVVHRSKIKAQRDVHVGDKIDKQINLGDHSTYNETHNG